MYLLVLSNNIGIGYLCCLWRQKSLGNSLERPLMCLCVPHGKPIKFHLKSICLYTWNNFRIVKVILIAFHIVEFYKKIVYLFQPLFKWHSFNGNIAWRCIYVSVCISSIACLLFIRVKNILHRSCRREWNTHLVFSTLSYKLYGFWGY